MQSQWGKKFEVGPAVGSIRDWEPSSLRAGPVERGPDAVGLTHSFVREGGCFSSWNTQGLVALTSFNLICIRAVFGGKHRFSLRGDIRGHGKQQQTVDLCLLPLAVDPQGNVLYSQTSGAHTPHTHTPTQADILLLPNYAYIMKSNLSYWNAS